MIVHFLHIICQTCNLSSMLFPSEQKLLDLQLASKRLNYLTIQSQRDAPQCCQLSSLMVNHWRLLIFSPTSALLSPVIVKLDKELKTQIAKASSVFGKLYHRLWDSHDVLWKVKVDVYKSVVLTTLLYGTEAWTLYRKHIRQLDSFHMRCLHEICRIKWSDKINNSEVLKRCNITSIDAILIKTNLRPPC